MNSDPEAKIRDLLTWLLQDPEQALQAAQEDVKTASPSPTGQPSAPVSSNRELRSPSADGLAEADPEQGDFDPLDLEEIDCLTPSSRGEMESGQSQTMPLLEGQPQEMGEIPTVQDRFQALLKDRLQTEIESHLPCFPWETEVCEYYDEVNETSGESTIAAQLWLTQLRTLNLPVIVPESVLAHLLDRCQDVVQSNLREGAKLVQAVASLFPDQFQMLNQLAGVVLMSPSRGSPMVAPETANFPPSYEAASPEQQMVLSLLAARQMIDDLTLNVSTSGATVERQWLTSAGTLTLQAVCHSDSGSQLCLQAVLPCGGSLRLQSAEGHSTAQRTDRGTLSVALFNVGVRDICALTVELEVSEQVPLQFSVCLTD